MQLRNLRPRSVHKNPELFAPLPKSWITLDEDQSYELLHVFPNGFPVDDLLEIAEHPALPEVCIRFGGSVYACKIVDGGHLRRCATPYVSKGAQVGLEIRFYAVRASCLSYIGCHYMSMVEGVLRRCTGVPDDSPIRDAELDKLRTSGDVGSELFFAMQFLLLHGGVSPQRYKQKSRISSVRNGAEMTKLPGKVEILSIREVDLKTAGERARKSLLPAPERTRRCPVWPVRGHWRQYRSGKKVYIAPFVKGPERDIRECPGREFTV
ncbi:MAG: hypothetical protein II387_00060 [Oscillospiraceae bacterium]|nr:hypothetical protein [Oscillospiraceae bacterium]